jgi:hypothetical protein
VADSEWLNLIIGGIAAAAIMIALFFIYTTRNKNKGQKPAEKPVAGIVDARESWLSRALKTEHTITIDDAKKAKDELKIMDLEREVLSYAIRRLYEAQAEGKITEEERERLAKWYKSRMMEVRDTINRNESVVALHELETMQEDLVKLFSNRFDELTKKVEEMRGALSLRTEEAQVETAPTPTLELEEEEAESEKEKEKKKPRKKPAPAAEPSGRTEAEKRIEEIKSEVEKVLERLGQIETEG